MVYMLRNSTRLKHCATWPALVMATFDALQVRADGDILCC